MLTEEPLDLRYPIGKFNFSAALSAEDIDRHVSEIEILPSLLEIAVENLSGEQLDTPYREEGWTVRQVIHHLPDSHLNAYIRYKLALTEDEPAISTYEEKEWAKLDDVFQTPVKVSLSLLENLHKRWVILLRSLTEEQLERCFVHPELGKVNIKTSVAHYAWHGNHHLAHIQSLINRMGWK